MDLHDQTQDVKGKFGERKLHDEMIVKRTTLQFNKRKDSTLYLKICKIFKYNVSTARVCFEKQSGLIQLSQKENSVYGKKPSNQVMNQV